MPPTSQSSSEAAASNALRWEIAKGGVIFLVGFLAMNLIFIFPAFRESWNVDRTAAGQLGDFVGGYVGTFFLLVSVVLLYATLNHQREDLKHQREDLKHQFDASTIQTFTTRYFELVKLQHDNVVEMEVQNTHGRRTFVMLVREFRAILSVVREVAGQHHQALTQRQVLHVAYYCLFFGTGPNSSRMLKVSLGEFDSQFVEALDAALSDEELKKRVELDRKLGYTPFEGHLSRLGHYYRHLYQTVCFVDQQELDFDIKYSYVKTIRAQLSVHEQVLLLINSLTPLGRTWWSGDLVTRYRLFKNIPRNFFVAETELDIGTLSLSKGYFEWEEQS